MKLHDASPEPASVAVQPVGAAGTKRYPYEPPSTNPPPTKATEDGPVRSTLTPETTAVPTFPARSTAVPVALCAAPSPNVDGGEQLSSPDVASPHVQVTVGAPVEAFHQPVPAAAGVTAPETDG